MRLSFLIILVCFQVVKGADVVLRYFKSSRFENHDNFSLSEAPEILKENSFSPLKPTVFYIHGYLESIYNDCSRVVVEAHLQRNNSNVIGLDWAAFSIGKYISTVASKSNQIGKDLGAAIITMLRAGLDINKIHIVGHSLGSHMAGYASRVIRDSNPDWLLPRISCLDPAYPLYYPSFPFILFGFDHISASDAQVVDVIHTDRMVYGALYSTGTVDFWPNGGHRIQPGCPKEFQIPFRGREICSHQISCEFWAQSVINLDAFLAVKCHGKNKTSIARMGYGADSGLTGDYYLKTKDITPFGSPYGLGQDGTDNVCGLISLIDYFI